MMDRMRPSENDMPHPITRRGLVLGGASAATVTIGFPRRAGAQATITLDQFRALSARLTGVPECDLNATAAGKLLDGLISLGRGPDLAVLSVDPGLSGTALADEIVAAWYSGSYATRAGVAAIDINDALLWKALDFTKPRGVCGGATGYWAEPYQN
jgi:hypothetical protein